MEGCWFLAPNTAIVATGVTILSVSSKYWTQTSTGYAGLWQGCTNYLGIWVCGDTKWPHSGIDLFCIHVIAFSNGFFFKD